MTTGIPFPSLFADFTTEGTTNNYILNGSLSANFAAWLTAINGTFSRGSSASFVNSSGNLSVNGAATNAIRFDFDPVALTCKGILLESAGTNLAISSGDIRTAGEGNGVSFWTAQATTAAASGTAPDGTSTATLFTANAGSGDHERFASVSQTGPVTLSLFAKASGANWIGIEFSNFATDGAFFNVSTGAKGSSPGSNVIQTSVVPYANGWFRISVTTSGNISHIQLMPCPADNSAFNYTAAGTESVFVWGIQVEAAASVSSYIPTVGSTASRSADSLSASPISSWYNGGAGTLYAFSDSANAAQSAPEILCISDVAGNNDFELRQAATSAMGRITSGGVAIFTPAVTDGGQVGDVINVLSRSAISATANNFIYMKNSGTADTLSSGAMPVSPTQILFGNGDFSLPMCGHLNQIGYWNSAFNSAQLQALTSGNFAFIPILQGPNVQTTLTNVPAKAFTRKHYEDLLEEIRDEAIAANQLLEGLSEKDRADLDFDVARAEFEELENSLGPTNYAKAMDAKEKLDKARKNRDHHYFMEIVNKEWAKLNG